MRLLVIVIQVVLPLQLSCSALKVTRLDEGVISLARRTLHLKNGRVTSTGESYVDLHHDAGSVNTRFQQPVLARREAAPATDQRGEAPFASSAEMEDSHVRVSENGPRLQHAPSPTQLPPHEDPATGLAMRRRIHRYRIIGWRHGQPVAQLQRRDAESTTRQFSWVFGHNHGRLDQVFRDPWSGWQVLTPDQDSSSLAIASFSQQGPLLSQMQRRQLMDQAIRHGLTETECSVLTHFLHAFRCPHPRDRLLKRDSIQPTKQSHASRPVQPTPVQRPGPPRSPANPPRYRYRIVGTIRGEPQAQLDHVRQGRDDTLRVEHVFGPPPGARLDETFPEHWQQWQWLTPLPPRFEITFPRFGSGGAPLSPAQHANLWNQLSRAGVPIHELGFAHTFLELFRFPQRPAQPRVHNAGTRPLNKRQVGAEQRIESRDIKDFIKSIVSQGESSDPTPRARTSFGSGRKSFGWSRKSIDKGPLRTRFYRIIGMRHQELVGQMHTIVTGEGFHEVQHDFGYPPPTLDFSFARHPWTTWQRLTPNPPEYEIVPLVRGFPPQGETVPGWHVENQMHDITSRVPLSRMEDLNVRRFFLEFRLPPGVPAPRRRLPGHENRASHSDAPRLAKRENTGGLSAGSRDAVTRSEASSSA